MIGADALRRQFQRRAILGRNLRHRRVDLGRAEGERLGRQLQPVEARRQVDHRLIAADAHILDDGHHGGIDIRRVFAFLPQQCGEGGFEIGIGGVQELRHGVTCLDVMAVLKDRGPRLKPPSQLLAHERGF